MTQTQNAGSSGAAGSTWDSALSSAEFSAVTGAGFDPVGQVLGTSVYNMAFTGLGGCPGAWSATEDGGPPSSRWTPSYASEVRTMYEVRKRALARVVEECRALGGDGIVGVTLRSDFPEGGLQFTVLGTAVRARSRIRPRTPFTSHLSGQDFARLIHSGWVPTGLAFGIGLAKRHDDWRTSRTKTWTVGNQEIDGHTQLIGHVRREAGRQLARNAAGQGGDGVVVDGMSLSVHTHECSQFGYGGDLSAEAVLVGTAIARFDHSARPAGPRPLTIMRLEREH
ncbi:heavy metal-binding domain-containing protein [Streptomyces sp. NPDC091371]|uniref:heavy metal-binding domain-containing protein n=1 Tax=Streptomyces sp. NPDC091371 TaxID=3155303 RepID=UPI003422F0A3